jgi:hypothetical protein
MWDLDVDAHIKNYWKKIDEAGAAFFEKQLNDWEYGKYGGSRTNFYNPDDDHPMRLALFLSFLDVSPLEEAMKQFYHRPASIKYLGSMGRTLIFMKVKQFTPGRTVNYLKTHPIDAELLGYEQKSDCSYELPCGETIRLNLKNRFGVEGVKKLDREIVVAMRKAAEALGIDLGECCGSDAFPVKAVGTDDAAEYNGHYDETGYKVATTESYAPKTGIIPLVGNVIGINDNEGDTLIPHIQELKSCGIHVKENFVDGKYATISNIAQAEIIERTVLHYDIAENWVYDYTATPYSIKAEYQKFHYEPDFKMNASEDFMMKYLVKKGCYGTVGYMLRNQHIAAKEECPDGYLDHFHQRNMTESENDYIKNDAGLQQSIKRKGKKAVELELHFTLLVLHVIALARLQNGCRKHLVSKRGLT